MGKLGPRAIGRAAIVLLPLVFGATSCSEGNAASTFDTSVQTTLALCRDERHVVVFDYFGTLTPSDEDLAHWLGEERVIPPARPGAAEVASAYRALGYEVLYLTTAPSEILLDDGRPLRDHIGDWLAQNGYPVGDGATVTSWDGNHTPMDWISTVLGQVVDGGASVDAAYTDNEDKAFAFKTAAPDQVFTLGAGATTSGSTPIPGDDMVAHAAEVTGLEPVCRAR